VLIGATISELLPVYAIVIVAIIIAVAVIITVYKRVIGRIPDPKLATSTIIIFSLLMGLSAILTYTSVIVESVPINHFVDKVDGQGMSIFIDREPTVLIPLKTVTPFPPRSTAIQVGISHNTSNAIETVKLSTTDSILSYPAKFTFVNSKSVNDSQRDNYTMEAYANHNLEVGNSTRQYTIDVIYSNATSNLPQKWSVPFNWPIQTMNMSIFSYFWIVLIGVLVSRLLSLVLDKLEKIEQTQDPVLKNNIKGQQIALNINDYIWITFSFIIAILIFSSFNEQVELTTNIIFNISLAFGFGFGFDKVLEVAKRFQNVV
jgi:hypothetical protein